jgi:hypothetical protein
LAGCHDSSSALVLLGADPAATAEGAEPGLGQISLKTTYIVDRAPGETMEDLMQVIFGGWPDWVDPPPPFIGEQTFLTSQSLAFGPLADGSPGMATGAQAAPIRAANRNGWKGALWDGFPVEMIRVQAIGN